MFYTNIMVKLLSKMTVYFSRCCVKRAVKKAYLSPILCRLILCYYRKVLLHQIFLSQSSKRFHMVDFKWQPIFTVLAFIKLVMVNFGHAAKFMHQQRQFCVITFRTLMQLQNHSFPKSLHLPSKNLN